MKKSKIISKPAMTAMLTALLVLGGCKIVDPLEACETAVEVRLDYRFSTVDGGGRPDPEEAALAEMVNSINLFLFDESAGNVLTQIVPVSHSEILSGEFAVNTLSGQYTMVAWGFSQSSLAGGGFTNVQMVDPTTNYHTPIVIGKTTLDQFRTLVLQPDDPTFADLFHAEVSHVEVPIPTNETTIVNVHFNFTRYTNTVSLKINGLDDVRTHLYGAETRTTNTRAEFTIDEELVPVDVFLTGKNGIFKHDGSLDENAPEFRYNAMPVASDDGATMIEMEIKTLQIDLERHAVDPLMLHIHVKDATTDAEMHRILNDLNLLALIQQVKNDNGEYLFRTQEQIDAAVEFPIELNIKRVPETTTPDPDEENPDNPDPGYKLVVEVVVADWKVDDLENLDVISN